MSRSIGESNELLLCFDQLAPCRLVTARGVPELDPDYIDCSPSGVTPALDFIQLKNAG